MRYGFVRTNTGRRPMETGCTGILVTVACLPQGDEDGADDQLYNEVERAVWQKLGREVTVIARLQDAARQCA